MLILCCFSTLDRLDWKTQMSLRPLCPHSLCHWPCIDPTAHYLTNLDPELVKSVQLFRVKYWVYSLIYCFGIIAPYAVLCICASLLWPCSLPLNSPNAHVPFPSIPPFMATLNKLLIPSECMYNDNVVTPITCLLTCTCNLCSLLSNPMLKQTG